MDKEACPHCIHCSEVPLYTVAQTCNHVTSCTFAHTGAPPVTNMSKNRPIKTLPHPSPSDEQKKTEISEFLDDLRELGIGDPKSPTAEGPGSSPPPSADTATSAESETHSAMTPVQQKLAQEWVPLELSFGVPLFNQRANRAICDKVIHSCSPNKIKNRNFLLFPFQYRKNLYFAIFSTLFPI